MGKHITEQQRYIIETMLKDKKEVKEIAERIGKSLSTLYKEIRKGTVELLNSDLTRRKEYCADAAQRITEERAQKKGRGFKIHGDYEQVKRIEHLIMDKKYSPYAAVKKLRADGMDCVCETTIYSYIDKGIFPHLTNSSLYSKKNKRKKGYKKTVRRPSLKKLSSRSIEERPEEIESRESYGHWEMDTVYSGKGKSASCLLVLTERAFRQERIVRLPDRKASSVISALDRMESVLGLEEFQKTFKTITCDNGSEFGDGKAIERSATVPGKSRTACFFCHPFCSSERGSNENANKLIRHFIGKGEDIGKVPEKKIKEIESWINSLPRKLFGGRSSNDLFREWQNAQKTP